VVLLPFSCLPSFSQKTKLIGQKMGVPTMSETVILLIAISSLIVTPIIFVLLLALADKYFSKFDNK